VGVKYRFYKEEKTLHPYITAMYGYNTAIFVSNATSYNKLFYGPSFGAGLDFRSAATKNGYLSLAVLIPVRGQDAFDYINDLKNHHHVEFKNELIPIGLSFGYRFILE
jgi:outer membrane protein W